MTSSDNTPVTDLEETIERLEHLKQLALPENAELRQNFLNASEAIPAIPENIAKLSPEEQSKFLLDIASFTSSYASFAYAITMLKALPSDVWKETVLDNTLPAIREVAEEMIFDIESRNSIELARGSLGSILGSNDDEDGIVSIFIVAVQGVDKDSVPDDEKDNVSSRFSGLTDFPDLTKK